MKLNSSLIPWYFNNIFICSYLFNLIELKSMSTSILISGLLVSRGFELIKMFFWMVRKYIWKWLIGKFYYKWLRKDYFFMYVCISTHLDPFFLLFLCIMTKHPLFFAFVRVHLAMLIYVRMYGKHFGSILVTFYTKSPW